MTDIPVKAHRKTVAQTAVILNISAKTVRRYLATGRLKKSGSQVLVESILAELRSDIDDAAGHTENTPLPTRAAVVHSRRRIISRGL